MILASIFTKKNTNQIVSVKSMSTKMNKKGGKTRAMKTISTEIKQNTIYSRLHLVKDHIMRFG